MEKESISYISLIFSIIAIIITVYGWKVRESQQIKLAKKKAIHDAIDEVKESIKLFTDTSLSFWLDNETKVFTYQLIWEHKQLYVKTKQLAALDKTVDTLKFNIALAKFKKEATIDMETKKNAISPAENRIRKLMAIAIELQSNNSLIKTW